MPLHLLIAEDSPDIAEVVTFDLVILDASIAGMFTRAT